MNIGLLGYGTVGAGVDELLKDHPLLSVVKIHSRTYRPAMGTRAVFSIDAITSDPSIDTVVEVIGGVYPAFDYVKAALEAGKNVVTANKALIAAHYPVLQSIAEAHQARLLFSAAAGGGIPWLKNLKRAREVDFLTGLCGIMNGTSNFILDRMLKNDDEYSTALLEAQERGYAEADPSADVDGPDTRRKLILSILTGFGVYLHEEDIQTLGIRFVKAGDMAYAKNHGRVIRLMGYAAPVDKSCVTAMVLPVMLPETAPEAGIPDCQNYFSYTGKQLGKQSFTGEGAGRYPTATNVIRDLTDLVTGNAPLPVSAAPSLAVLPDGEETFYIRGTLESGLCKMSFPDFFREVSARIRNGEAVFAAWVPSSPIR